MKTTTAQSLLAVFAALLFAPVVSGAVADVTGLVPTIWWDFETQPTAAGLATSNKGSASISFTSEGTVSYAAGITNGWALNTANFTPYSAAGTFSTAGNAFTISAVMTLGTNPNGITLNVRNATVVKDLIIRRGTTAGSLVVGVGPQAQPSEKFLVATFADGDAAYHLVTIVAEQSGMKLYVDGAFVDMTTEFTMWGASGYASQMQFGSHLNGAKAGEAKFGGRIDDLRIHDAALTPAQIGLIAAEYGFAVPNSVFVQTTGEPTVGPNSFSTSFTLLTGENDVVEAAIVYGTDAALSAPTTNALGSAFATGTYTASLTALAAGTTYWGKIVVRNGNVLNETSVFSFHTRDVLVETDFVRRVPITVSGYAGASTLTNFPVLVTLSTGSPHGFDYADCAADGADLRFADADGVLVPHDIESWNTNGTSYIWVLVPRLSGTGTRLTLYYGANPAGLPAVAASDVWSKYVVVVHGGDALANAAGNGLTVAAGSSSVTADMSAGIAGGGIAKSTNNAKGLNVANPSEVLSNAGQFSVSGWFKRDGNGGNGDNGTHILAGSQPSWNNVDGFLLIQEKGLYISVAYKGGHNWQSGSYTLANRTWGHVAFAYASGVSLTSYFNGNQDQTTSTPKTLVNTTVSYWTFGSYGNAASTDSFKGEMDELRVFNGVASADWIKAEHDSVADPASFAVCSAAESTDEDIPRFGAIAASDANGSVTFSVELDTPGFGGEVPTSVSVFYGTDGENWTELSLGSTNAAATLTGSASGFAGRLRVLWYARATATRNGVPKTMESAQQAFVTKALDPVGNYKFFTATVDWDGNPEENVPVLLRLSEAAIRGFEYADVTVSGFEIVGEDGHLLPYEIDTWDPSGESLIWVRLSDYRDGATFTVRYGAAFANAALPASDVWGDYVGVWHLSDTNSASAYGSYPNSTATVGIDGEKAQASIAGEAGRIGKSVKICDATKQGTGYQLGGVFVPDSGANSPLDLGGTFVISGWFKHKNQDYYYDKFFAKRKVANNSGTPNGAFAIESGANGSANNVSALGGGTTCTKVNFNSTLRNTWSHLTFVYNDNNLRIYQDGAYCNGFAINPATDNDAPLCFGNMTGGYGNGTGDCAWCGWIDEVRLADRVPSAAWLAAEYHAMADAGAVVYSAVMSSDTTAPVLGTPSVASNPDGSFTVSVEVSENAPASIHCTIDGTDYAMTTSDASLPTTYAAVVSDLPDGTYTTSVRATGIGGTTVSATCPMAFHVGALTVEVLSDADEGTLAPGTFRISRLDADSTGLPALTFDVAFSGDGLAAIAPPAVSTLAIPAGESHVDLAITPIYTTNVNVDTEVVLAASGTSIGLPSSNTMAVVNADYDVAVRYVATTGDDENHGGTPELPKKTIAAAVASLAYVAQTRAGTVHVAPGLYRSPSPVVVTNAIHVLGDDPDPSRTIVSNTGSIGFYGSHNQRLFTINHAEALVANLTLQKGIAYYDVSGGDFYIGSKGGIVSNCVVEAGDANSNGLAGGGYMDGGKVTHTIFRRNTCNSGSVNWARNRPGVLSLNGSSAAENCLFDNNPQSKNVVLISLNGSSAMRNCSIVNTGLSITNADCTAWSALQIASAATVQNVVIAGVTNRIDGAACPPTGTVASFLNGAFDGDVTGLPAGTVTGAKTSFFRNCAAGDYRPSLGGPLTGKGANYDGMAAVDLSGKQKRLIGKQIDIGAYEANTANTLLIMQ